MLSENFFGQTGFPPREGSRRAKQFIIKSHLCGYILEVTYL